MEEETLLIGLKYFEVEIVVRIMRYRVAPLTQCMSIVDAFGRSIHVRIVKVKRKSLCCFKLDCLFNDMKPSLLAIHLFMQNYRIMRFLLATALKQLEYII